MKYVWFDTIEQLLEYERVMGYEIIHAWENTYYGDISAIVLTSFVPFAKIALILLVVATYFFIKQVNKIQEIGVK